MQSIPYPFVLVSSHYLTELVLYECFTCVVNVWLAEKLLFVFCEKEAVVTEGHTDCKRDRASVVGECVAKTNDWNN